MSRVSALPSALSYGSGATAMANGPSPARVSSISPRVARAGMLAGASPYETATARTAGDRSVSPYLPRAPIGSSPARVRSISPRSLASPSWSVKVSPATVLQPNGVSAALRSRSDVSPGSISRTSLSSSPKKAVVVGYNYRGFSPSHGDNFRSVTQVAMATAVSPRSTVSAARPLTAEVQPNMISAPVPSSMFLASSLPDASEGYFPKGSSRANRPLISPRSTPPVPWGSFTTHSAGTTRPGSLITTGPGSDMSPQSEQVCAPDAVNLSPEPRYPDAWTVPPDASLSFDVSPSPGEMAHSQEMFPAPVPRNITASPSRTQEWPRTSALERLGSASTVMSLPETPLPEPMRMAMHPASPLLGPGHELPGARSPRPTSVPPVAMARVQSYSSAAEAVSSGQAVQSLGPVFGSTGALFTPRFSHDGGKEQDEEADLEREIAEAANATEAAHARLRDALAKLQTRRDSSAVEDFG